MSELKTVLNELSNEAEAMYGEELVEMEALAQEVDSILGFTTAVSHSFEAFIGSKDIVTQQDLDNYRVSLESILTISGVGHSADLFLSNEAEEVKEKKESLVGKTIAAIKALLKRFLDWITGKGKAASESIKNKLATAKKKVADFKEKVRNATKGGITVVANIPNPDGEKIKDINALITYVNDLDVSKDALDFETNGYTTVKIDSTIEESEKYCDALSKLLERAEAHIKDDGELTSLQSKLKALLSKIETKEVTEAVRKEVTEVRNKIDEVKVGISNAQNYVYFATATRMSVRMATL